MFQKCNSSLRHRLFHQVRQTVPFHFNPIKSIFPLIYQNNLITKTRNSWEDFQGRREYDDDHKIPVVGTRLDELTTTHKWSHWDQYINPQVTRSWKDLSPSSEYVGPRSGHNVIKMGWMKIGGSWKYSRGYNDSRKGFAKGTWQERKMTPRFMLAPRVSAGGPRNRYEGKAVFSRISLSKVLWAIDSGRLNPNETITLYHLRQANIISEREIVWPGFVLLAGNIESLAYPINIELQNASFKAIKLIEDAGGSFTCTYMTHEGLYKELHPEEYPSFIEEGIPEKKGLESFATNPAKGGWLAQWYEDESKYANLNAGRRSSHYVRPPQSRDFPTSVDEYEIVKHHQKWHLNQPGTGTVLPWHSYNTTDLAKRSTDFALMNQMKKNYKVKGVRERTTLIEFMVTKRTKFLDYLKELHTFNGAFWMNVIHLNIFDLSEHFRVSGDCLKFNYLFESSSPSSNLSCFTTSSLSKDDRATNESNADFCNDTWLSRYLPSLSILCMSLSDFLSAPLTGDEFVECVYGVLLELEVAFAGGSATRAMALHNLNAFRENFSSKIARIMNTGRREDQIDISAENKVEFKAKYIFMRKGSEAYIPIPVSYDAIISPLCTVLSFTYRKLCDYDQIHNPDIAKRVISIDKRLEKVFFARITEEIEKVAHSKLIRESLLLSTEGLFMGFAEDSLVSTLDPLKFSTASSETETNRFDESSSSNETSGDDE